MIRIQINDERPLFLRAGDTLTVIDRHTRWIFKAIALPRKSFVAHFQAMGARAL